MSSDTERAHDILTNFINKLDELIEDHLDPELERITAKLKDEQKMLFDLPTPGFKPTNLQMNEEMRYIQWRDEILKLHKAGVLSLPGDVSKT